MTGPYSCGKNELKLQKRLILLGDPFISMIGSDFTPGEVPPHPNPPPPRGEGWVGEDHSCFFLCNIEVDLEERLAMRSDQKGDQLSNWGTDNRILPVRL